MADSRWTARRITATKGKQKLVCLTAYDYATARLVDQSDVELILVGDSLAMTMLGHETTLPVTVDEMLHHTRAVVRGVKQALVVGDMPFMSYQASDDNAMHNAGRFIKEAGAGAVKLEGGELRVPLVERMVSNGIPVLAHIGLTPQTIRAIGGYKVQGREGREAERLIQDARALAQAGAFAIVLECMPKALAAEITKELSIPTIGIGAGPMCDGQILVVHDMLGAYGEISPKFIKRYAHVADVMRQAFGQYADEVRNGEFPGPEHSYR